MKYHDTGNGWTFVSASASKNSFNDAIVGVGMLVGPRALKSLNSIEKIQPRMMVAMFNGNPSTTIISCYSPTNVSDETDLIAFYNEQSSFVCSIPNHSVLLIGRDMNVKIVKNVNNKLSFHNSKNRNGEHLTDFTLENRWTCLNTKFQKMKGKLWTYTDANKTKAQVDYILMNQKWNNSTLNCATYVSFKGVSFDYPIVTAEIQQKLRRNAKRTTTIVQDDCPLLNNSDINDKYTLILRNIFDALSEISETPTPNDDYEKFVHTEEATECILTKQRAKPCVQWEILAIGKKHADVKTASLCNRRNPTNTNAQKLKMAQNELTYT